MDGRHSRYVADHVPGARYVELPGSGPVFTGDVDGAADVIEQFLTGVRRPVVSDRVLATVLFTDIVGSTERAAALGDGAWRALLERHDELVRRGGRAPSRAVREVAGRRRARHVRRAEPGDQQRAGHPRRRPRAWISTSAPACTPVSANCWATATSVGSPCTSARAISSLAEPGEVLVSSTVRDLIVGSGQTLADRGERELKGLPGAWRVFAVEG